MGVAGLGYMGLATALGFAHHGRRVLGYDRLDRIRRALASGETPIHEPGLARLLRSELERGRFRVLDNWTEFVRSVDVLFLCLPTPSRWDGSIDLGPISAGVTDLGEALRGTSHDPLTVVKSSVVPGTTEGVLRPLLARTAARPRDALALATNPEFLAEGSMVHDVLHPERIVVGVGRREDARVLRGLYAAFRAPLVVLSTTGAELVKYSANAFLATKVALANELSRVAEVVGVDIDPVLGAVGKDTRIGSSFLQAGPGFGGSCFEKDLRALLSESTRQGVNLSLLASVVRSNEDQAAHAFALVRASMGGVDGRRVALLGLSFKPGTDDVRGSRAFPLAAAVLADGGSLQVHDPVALGRFREAWREWAGEPARGIRFCTTPEEALLGADVAIVHTPWPEYRSFPRAWVARMRTPLVVDLRRSLSPAVRRRGDLRWVGLGSAQVLPMLPDPLLEDPPVGPRREGRG